MRAISEFRKDEVAKYGLKSGALWAKEAPLRIHRTWRDHGSERSQESWSHHMSVFVEVTICDLNSLYLGREAISTDGLN